MIELILFMYSFFTYIHDGSKTNNPEDEISCVRISRLFPFIGEDGKPLYYDTIADKVYFYRNQVLYQAAYTANERTSDGELKKTETRYNSFVYTVGNTTGHLFDLLENQLNKIIAVDSFYRMNWLSKPNLEKMFSEYDTSFVSSAINIESGTEEEVYRVKNKKDSTQHGTFFFYYSDKMNHSPWSFSRKLDSLKNRKLYKVRMISDAGFIKECNAYIDTIETGFYMEDWPVDNPKEKMQFFDLDRKGSIISD